MGQADNFLPRVHDMNKVWNFFSTCRASSFIPDHIIGRKGFINSTSSLANLSDHPFSPESHLLDHSRLLVPRKSNQTNAPLHQFNHEHDAPVSSENFPEEAIILQEAGTHPPSDEIDEAWDAFHKSEGLHSVNLRTKSIGPQLLARSKPVYTPSQSLPSPLSSFTKPVQTSNALPSSSRNQPECPSLEWRTRAKSQTKMDYYLAVQITRDSADVSSESVAFPNSEEEAWLSFDQDRSSNTLATKSRVLCQARSVERDPYAQEAARYVDSWSKVMEMERQNEAFTAMKRLYDIQRRSGHRYNPLGKSLVNMVISPVDPPDFIKPAHRSDIYLRVERPDESEIGLCNFRHPEEDFVDGEVKSNTSMPTSFSKDIFISCRLVSKRTYHLIVRLENSDADLTSQTYRLDYGWDGTSFDRTSAAVQALHDDPDALRRNLTKKDIERTNLKITGSSLRHPLLLTRSNESFTDDPITEYPNSPSSTFHLFTRDQRINSWARRHLRHPPLKMPGDPDLGHLNEPQTRAIAMAISTPLSLIQGPPGTGKTQTIIQMIALLKIHFQVSQPIAVCAPTHISVDNLVIGLVKAGLKPVRCGEQLKVASEVAQYSLETLELQHSLTPTIDAKSRRLESLTKDLDAIEKRWRNVKPTVSSKRQTANTKQARVLEILKTEYKRLLYEVYILKRRRQLQIIASSDVVCCTCLGAGASGLDAVEFASVIIDEAAMCHEPTALVPLTKGSAHAVLVGDHKQLPAITLSPAAEAHGFGISLFERLQSQQNVQSILLNKQYRMNPIISAFPNAEFYDHALVDSIKPDTIKPVYFHLDRSLQPEKQSRAVSFVTHNHPETKIEKTLTNQMEAEIVLSILRDLLLTNPDLSGHDIGIIAPYRGQVSLLQSLQRQPQKASLIRNLEQSYRNEVEINTVDGFQGREKPVIILSCVRGNVERQIGFLADLRRFNVAATRAKQKFIVVGHLDTLQYAHVNRHFKFGGHYNAESWRRWVRWAKSESLLIDSEKFRGK
ncbi:P-loop containing nucleoside triphosphate hydrolase protein [Melampsora americana]|nr:P-loop containing nucleoside triphosphate hydrolase protein [Melampsora americana]